MNTVNSGSVSMQARTRGPTSSRSGDSPSTSSASICSVRRIEPSSAPRLAPERPATINPAPIGANSSTTARARPCGKYSTPSGPITPLKRIAQVHPDHRTQGQTSHDTQRQGAKQDGVELPGQLPRPAQRRGVASKARMAKCV